METPNPPSRHGVQPSTYGRSYAKSPYSEDLAKSIIQEAVLPALAVVVETLHSEEASASEKLRAAFEILRMGYGKELEALQFLNEKSDASALIAELYQKASKPVSKGGMENGTTIDE